MAFLLRTAVNLRLAKDGGNMRFIELRLISLDTITFGVIFAHQFYAKFIHVATVLLEKLYSIFSTEKKGNNILAIINYIFFYELLY